MRYRLMVRGGTDLDGMLDVVSIDMLHRLTVDGRHLVPANTTVWFGPDRLPVWIPADLAGAWDLEHQSTCFTCPSCGATSHHPEDLANRYCGACREFTG